MWKKRANQALLLNTSKVIQGHGSGAAHYSVSSALSGNFSPYIISFHSILHKTVLNECTPSSIIVHQKMKGIPITNLQVNRNMTLILNSNNNNNTEEIEEEDDLLKVGHRRMMVTFNPAEVDLQRADGTRLQGSHFWLNPVWVHRVLRIYINEFPGSHWHNSNQVSKKWKTKIENRQKGKILKINKRGKKKYLQGNVFTWAQKISCHRVKNIFINHEYNIAVKIY